MADALKIVLRGAFDSRLGTRWWWEERQGGITKSNKNKMKSIKVAVEQVDIKKKQSRFRFWQSCLFIITSADKSFSFAQQRYWTVSAMSGQAFHSNQNVSASSSLSSPNRNLNWQCDTASFYRGLWYSLQREYIHRTNSWFKTEEKQREQAHLFPGYR